jgi:hypothetical protein
MVVVVMPVIMVIMTMVVVIVLAHGLAVPYGNYFSKLRLARCFAEPLKTKLR